MNICFTLSMPNRGSWNGKWSGENDLYAKVVTLSKSKKNLEKVKKIIDDSPYYYSWDDGWGASIEAKEVSQEGKRKAKKLSKGFCGYEWMINNILDHGSAHDKRSL